MSDSEGSAYRHVLKYTSLFGGVQGLSILMALVKNKIAAVILGPTGMGHLSLFNSSMNFISQVTNLGIPFSAVRSISEAYDSGDEGRLTDAIAVLRAWSLLTALLGALVCVITGPLMDAVMFSWGDHTLHFVALAPSIALTALSGGEVAILKGTRRLRQLALQQLYVIFGIVVVSLPLYLLFGNAAIIPVIIVSAVITLGVAMVYSYRYYPMRGFALTKRELQPGVAMVKLGIVYTAANILGAGSEIAVRSFLNIYGSIEMVGYYNAAYMLTITYAGMVFSAMDSDYFPRLSTVGDDREALCNTVNSQIEVAMLILAPMLALFIVLMPLILPLLYSGAFTVVAGMAQIAVFSMYIKAIGLPICYISLAKGNSKAYFLTETLYYVSLVVLVIIGYRAIGLSGAGAALALAHVVELVVAYAYMHHAYGYRLSRSVITYAALQITIGIATYFFTNGLHSPLNDLVLTEGEATMLRYGVGIVLFASSAAFSFAILRRRVRT